MKSSDEATMYLTTGDKECLNVDSSERRYTPHHDITNKCCNQFGERDEMQKIINSLQADVIARGARIADLEKQCDELYNLAIEAGVCAEYLRVNFTNE